MVWRYLAPASKPEGSSFKYQQDGEDFGVLVPQDRSSTHPRLKLVSQEKIRVRGTDRDRMRLNLKAGDFDWALSLDEQDHCKLIRVAIPADSIEVLRD